VKIKLHTAIFIGMVFGVLCGIVVRNTVTADIIPEIVSWIKPIGELFLRMIFMMVIPLVVSALILGVADFGDVSRLGKIGWKMFVYTLIVTGISVLLGIASTAIIKPGSYLSEKDRSSIQSQFNADIQKQRENIKKVEKQNFLQTIVKIVPKNPLEDMVRAFDTSYTGGGLLAVMFFALILGIAMSNSPPEKVEGLKSALEGLYEITMRVIGYAMKLAPVGVASLLFVLTVNTGLSILGTLLGYMALVLSVLALHLFGTYSIILKFFCNMSPRYFFKQNTELMLTAFTTSSSNASLPTALKTANEKLKLPKDISHFVLTIGSTANQNGTALYEGITILFLAQCFGVHLDLTQQITVVLVSILAGMGTAGVPGGSIPVMMLILDSIGVPGESIAIILGVDRILDMSRTVLNVTGDMTAAVYISHTERNN